MAGINLLGAEGINSAASAYAPQITAAQTLNGSGGGTLSNFFQGANDAFRKYGDVITGLGGLYLMSKRNATNPAGNESATNIYVGGTNPRPSNYGAELFEKPAQANSQLGIDSSSFKGIAMIVILAVVGIGFLGVLRR